MTDLKERVISAFRWAAMARFVGQLISWVMSLVVVRLLVPGDYGQAALAMMFTSTLGLLSELGLGAALVQHARQLEQAHLRQLFSVVLGINAALCMVTLLAAPLVAMFFDEVGLSSILSLLSLQFIAQAFVIVPQAMLQRELDFKRRSIVDVAAVLLGGAVSLLLALSGAGVWALVWGSLATVLGRAIGLNLLVSAPLIPTFQMGGVSHLFSFGGYVTINRVLWAIYSQADVFVAGKWLGKDLLGVYSMAIELASLPVQKLNAIINEVAFPAFARLQGQQTQLTYHFLKGVRLISILAFPVFWGLSAVAPETVDLVLGERWHRVGEPMRLLALLMPFQMVVNLIFTFLQGIGRPDINVTNLGLSTLIMPVAFYLGTGRGVEGLCMAWMIAYPIVFIITLWVALPIIGVKASDLSMAMILPLIAGLGIIAAVSLARTALPIASASVSAVCMYTAIGAAVYGAIMAALNRQGCRELYQLVRG